MSIHSVREMLGYDRNDNRVGVTDAFLITCWRYKKERPLSDKRLADLDLQRAKEQGFTEDDKYFQMMMGAIYDCKQ